MTRSEPDPRRALDGARHIAVLADLHLGRRDATDQFAADDRSFREALERLIEGVDRALLLGDILELQRGPFPFAQAYERRRVLDEHRELVELLREPRFLWFTGNHDGLLAETDGALDELLLDVAGEPALFLHGHRADWVVSEVPIVQHVGSWVGGMAERAGLRPAYALLCSLDAALNGVHEDPRRCRLVSRLMTYAAERGASRVFCGHIHTPLRYETPTGRIYRPGSCTGGRLRALLIDRESGEVRHHDERL